MQHFISVIVRAGGSIFFCAAEYILVCLGNIFQRLVESTIDGIVVVVALNRLDGIEAVNRLQIIHAGKGADQIFRAAHHIAEGHGAVFDLTFMVQTDKAAGITAVIAAVCGIVCTTSVHIVSGRNAGYRAGINISAVALDEVDFYIGDIILVDAVFRTGQLYYRIADCDNGKVALPAAQILVQRNADIQAKQRNLQCLSVCQHFHGKRPAKVDVNHTDLLQVTNVQNA